MPSLLLKRDTNATVVNTTLLPGELAAAIDTGDIYIGKADGTKERMANDADLTDLITTSDEAISNPVNVDTGSIGPVDMAATKIIFTDGDTFQQKYESGALNGPAGPKGDPGIGSASNFDVTIRTQQEFDVLIASPNWFGATSIAFIGDGGSLKFTRSDKIGTRIPPSVKQIQGFNGASFQSVDVDIDEASGVCKGVLYYDVVPEGRDCYIRDISVEAGNTSSDRHVFVIGFSNCCNLSNCTVTVGPGSGYGFYLCNNLSGCDTIVETNHPAVASSGFGGCYGLIDCNVKFNIMSKVDDKLDMTCYNSCTNLVNCDGYINGSSGSTGIVPVVVAATYVFLYCDNLTNCHGDISGVTATAAAFYKSSRLTNCRGNVTGRANSDGFVACYQLVNCFGSGVSETAEFTGYTIRDCSHLNGCRQLGTTGFLGGTNTMVDTLTVAAAT